MSKIEEQNTGKKEGEIRYLTPLNIDTSTQKKYGQNASTLRLSPRLERSRVLSRVNRALPLTPVS